MLFGDFITHCCIFNLKFNNMIYGTEMITILVFRQFIAHLNHTVKIKYKIWLQLI